MVVVLAQEELILGDSLHLHLLLLLFGELFLKELGSGDACLLEQHFWLKPTVSHLQLPLDLLPDEVQLVDRLDELAADVHVLVKREFLAFIFAEVKAVERVLEREAMRDLKLLPSNDATCSNLVRLDLESTVLIAEQVSLLSENSRQYSNNRPA